VRRFRLDIAYDGTDFEGWQSQVRDGLTREGVPRQREMEDGRTVQAEIEKALAVLVKAKCPITGAGRTDSGVHARGQTAHFDAATRMQGADFIRGLNSLLPADVRILHCQETDPSFHARFSALARVYHYHIVPAQSVMPWEVRYVHRVYNLPPLVSLNAMANLLHGEIDFTSFAHAKDPSPSKNRYMYHASFFPQGDRVIFRIAGNAFLWRMVRSLVGTLLDLGDRGLGAPEFAAILEARDRRRAGPTAPGQGLYLQKVIYDEREFAF
jgi:tRNA pseudouridine38-40 synthase